MNRIVTEWYEKKENIDEMRGWDKGKLKIWEQQVTDKFPLGARILDIGSGMGREAFALYRQGFEVIGLDISKNAVNFSNDEAINNECKVKFFHYDGEHIPFKDETFDVVIIWNQTFGLLYGDGYKEDYIRECRRVLKSEGLFSYSGHSVHYISEHFSNYLVGSKFFPYKEGDIYWETFTLEELVAYAKNASFKVIRSGIGEIYVPEDGVILHCLCEKNEI